MKTLKKVKLVVTHMYWYDVLLIGASLIGLWGLVPVLWIIGVACQNIPIFFMSGFMGIIAWRFTKMTVKELGKGYDRLVDELNYVDDYQLSFSEENNIET